MKTALQDCGHWRKAIRAWVGEGVAGERTVQIQSHLAACPDCRRYAEELRAATAGLRWLASRDVEPSPGFRSRWTRAVAESVRPNGFGETAAATAASWLELLRRNFRPALGMASLWILALLFRLSAPADLSPAQTAAAHSPVEIGRALGAGHSLLAWQHWKLDLLSVPPRQLHPPQPRSQTFPARPTGQLDHAPAMHAAAGSMFAAVIVQPDLAALPLI
jgi:hypothetical protein